jgi:hypothetical protein
MLFCIIHILLFLGLKPNNNFNHLSWAKAQQQVEPSFFGSSPTTKLLWQ